MNIRMTKEHLCNLRSLKLLKPNCKCKQCSIKLGGLLRNFVCMKIIIIKIIQTLSSRLRDSEVNFIRELFSIYANFVRTLDADECVKYCK